MKQLRVPRVWGKDFIQGGRYHRNIHRHLRREPWLRWTHQSLGCPDFCGHLSVPRGTREEVLFEGEVPWRVFLNGRREAIEPFMPVCQSSHHLANYSRQSYIQEMLRWQGEDVESQ